MLNKKPKREFLAVTASASNTSAARLFANAVANMLHKATGDNIQVKIEVTGRDQYKITWWYIDMPFAREFSRALKDHISLADDNFEYDVEGNPVLESNKSYIEPVKLVKRWYDSGKCKSFAAVYGLSVVSRLYTRSMQQELTGSNARDWERITGEKPKSSNIVYTMTLRVEQLGEANETTDYDWAIKCLDTLFRYGKIYTQNKKQYLPPEDQDFKLEHIVVDPVKRKNSFIFNLTDYALRKVGSLEAVEDAIEYLVHKYYPEIEPLCELSNNGINQVTLLVHET